MNRPDFSDYVAHFTKDTDPLGATENSKDTNIQTIKGTAYERLVNIFKSKKILATPMPWTNKSAVAFTECPFWSLIDHARNYSPYGVGFTKAHLFAAGGGPAIYLRPDLHEKQKEYRHKDHVDWQGFHPSLYSFVTTFMPDYAPPIKKEEWAKGTVDYTHEREWRVPHDFSFQLGTVQFVIVKTYDDMARFPKELKDAIGREKFLIMDMYQLIENIWPTHRLDSRD